MPIFEIKQRGNNLERNDGLLLLPLNPFPGIKFFMDGIFMVNDELIARNS